MFEDIDGFLEDLSPAEEDDDVVTDVHGLTVFVGETGHGKTLMMTAIAKALQDLICDGIYCGREGCRAEWIIASNDCVDEEGVVEPVILGSDALAKHWDHIAGRHQDGLHLIACFDEVQDFVDSWDYNAPEVKFGAKLMIRARKAQGLIALATTPSIDLIVNRWRSRIKRHWTCWTRNSGKSTVTVEETVGGSEVPPWGDREMEARAWYTEPFRDMYKTYAHADYSQLKALCWAMRDDEKDEIKALRWEVD